MKKWRVGIIGAGVVGLRLGRYFQKHPHSIVVAICDVNKQSASNLAKSLLGSSASSDSSSTIETYSDYKDVCASKDLDIIYVAVPPSLHAQIAIEALKHSKHVLCEKPLALSNEETFEMVKASREDDKLVTGVNLPFRYSVGVKRIKQMLAEDRMGKVSRLELLFEFPDWPRKWQLSDWVGKKYEGGPLREVGTHFYFLLIELFGNVKKITGKVEWPEQEKDSSKEGDINKEAKSEVYAKAQIELENGLLCDLSLKTGKTGAVKEANSLFIYGEKMDVKYEDWWILSVKEGKNGEWKDVSRNNSEFKAEDSSRDIVEDFLSSCEGKLSNLVSFEIAAQTNSVLNALFTSENQPVLVSKY